MKQQRQYPKIMISRKAERSVKDGHPWIYGEEILKTEANSKTAVWWMCLPETPLWGQVFTIVSARLPFDYFTQRQ